jgi:2-dehydro-3-deoxygluconokinase
MDPFDLLAIGEPLIEFNETVPDGGTYRQGFGGDTSNAAIAAARHGARVAYISRVGDDRFGRQLRGLWLAEGVDDTGVATDPAAPTGVYFVSHDAAGHHFHYLRAGSAASRMSPATLPFDIVRRARIVLASGISLAISDSAAATVGAAFAAARAAGGRVAFDSNLRLRLWSLDRARPAIAAAAAGADFFLPSLDDARLLSGRDSVPDNLAWAESLGAGLVVLKLGAAGAIVSAGGARTSLPGHRVAAVDATGAGDCFAGAFLARIAAGDDALDAARYANAAAALATTGFGAVAPLPRPDAVRALLAESDERGVAGRA